MKTKFPSMIEWIEQIGGFDELRRRYKEFLKNYGNSGDFESFVDGLYSAEKFNELSE